MNRRAFLYIFIPTLFFTYSASAEESEGKSNIPWPIRGRVFIETREPRFVKELWKVIPETNLGRIAAVGDFNGDGYSDILLAKDDKTSTLMVYLAKESAFQGEVWESGGANLRLSTLLSFDFNGDNCQDLLSPDQNTPTSWWLLISTCRGKFESTKYEIFPEHYLPGKFYIFDNTPDGQIGIIVQNAMQVKKFARVSYLPDSGLLLNSILHYTDYPESTIIGAGHFENNPVIRLMWAFKTSQKWWTASSGLFSAYFPAFNDWSDGLLGDYNGDGSTDVLVHGSGIMGWWLGLATRGSALERPVKGLENLNDNDNLASADFDGDGLDDVIKLDVIENQVLLALSRLSVGLPDGSVSINKQTIKVDSRGYFKSDEQVDNSLKIRVSHPKYKIIPEYVEIQGTTYRHRMLKFLALLPPADSEVGAAFSLAEKGMSGPFVCLGYQPSNTYKWLNVFGNEVCPKGYAYYSVSDFSTNGKAQDIAISGNCCRLPEDDILEDDHVFAIDSCPENYVGTGAKYESKSCYETGNCMYYLRCSKINLRRYQLGPPQGGTYWGFGYTRGSQEEPISWEQLPLAIRFGAGRSDYSSWETDGCIGTPPGSLITEKRAKKCSSISFRELQYSGLPGDPPRGTPVPMFPKCKEMINIYDPASGCIEEMNTNSN